MRSISGHFLTDTNNRTGTTATTTTAATTTTPKRTCSDKTPGYHAGVGYTGSRD